MSTETKQRMTDTEYYFEAPLDDATQGKLSITSGVSRLSLDSEAGMSQLMRAQFERPLPEIKVRDGIVRVHYLNFSLVNWLFNWRQPRAEITLNASIPWSVEVRGGVSSFDADLSQVQLTDMYLQDGVSHLWATLPELSGTVPIRLTGGVSDMTILRPGNVPVRIQVRGGISSLTLDDQHFGSMAILPQLESPGYAQAAGRYDIQISGGVSHIVVGK